MRMVYTAFELFKVKYISDLLTQAEIPNTTRNVDLTGAAGELPITEIWPEIWVVDADDEQRARDLIASIDLDAALATPSGEAWTCPQCGEALEAQFDSCWNCGTAR